MSRSHHLDLHFAFEICFVWQIVMCNSPLGGGGGGGFENTKSYIIRQAHCVYKSHEKEFVNFSQRGKFQLWANSFMRWILANPGPQSFTDNSATYCWVEHATCPWPMSPLGSRYYFTQKLPHFIRTSVRGSKMNALASVQLAFQMLTLQTSIYIYIYIYMDRIEYFFL